MEEPIHVSETLDARGLSCPMPIVKAKLTINKMQAGEVLQVLCTDRGSLQDFAGWARSTPGVELLKQETTTDGNQTVYTHYIVKTA